MTQNPLMHACIDDAVRLHVTRADGTTSVTETRLTEITVIPARTVTSTSHAGTVVTTHHDEARYGRTEAAPYFFDLSTGLREHTGDSWIEVA